MGLIKKTGYSKEIFSLATPIILHGIFEQLQILIDRAFLGNINADFLSALGNVFFPIFTTMSMLWAVTTGTTVLISQNMGAEKPEEAQKFAETSLLYNSMISWILFVFWFFADTHIFRLMGVQEPILGFCTEYSQIYIFVFLWMGLDATMGAILQGYGKTSPIMYAGLIRSVVNIILDYILIFGHFGFPKMGIQGAALATLIASFTASLYLGLTLVFSRKIKLGLRLGRILKARLSTYKQVIRLGLPSSAEEMLWHLGNLTLLRFLNMISPSAAGIYTLVFSIELIPILIYMGLGRASTTLVGNSTGARNQDKAVKIGMRALIYSLLTCLLIAMICFIAPSRILGIFTNNTAMINQSVLFLLIACFTMFPRSGNIIMGSGIRGYGDTRWMLGTQIFGTAYIITLAWLMVFVFDAGLIGIFLALFIDETTRGIINTIRFRKGFFRKGFSPFAHEKEAQSLPV